MPIPIVTAAEMRAMDRATIDDVGIPGEVLMERAGQGVFYCMVAQRGGGAGAAPLWTLGFRTGQGRPPLQGTSVAVFCGSGNNGGDGYVVARYLHQAGARVSVFGLASEERIRGDARTHYDAMRAVGIPCEFLPETVEAAEIRQWLSDVDWVVDALLGTGLSSPVRGRYRAVIEGINACPAWTVAVDIPSGLDADSGQPLGVAVRADLTVTFAFPKRGLVGTPGAEYVGALQVVDIGIPDRVVADVAPRSALLEERDARAAVTPRPLAGHKGTFGHVLCVAGSPGRTGAAVLAARAAARVGAGLVTVAAPESALPALMAQSLETMGAAYPDAATPASDTLTQLWELLRGKSALLVGPGIPTSDAMLEVLRELLSDGKIPVVLDADGLNLLSRAPRALQEASGPILLTPHPGEMARLLGRDVPAVQADRFGAAAEAASRFGAWVALKGARTVIAEPDGALYVNPTGNPGMGSGGMGDVLAGMVAGLLAQGVSPGLALRAAVYLHGAAGDAAAERLGQRGLLAGDLLDALPPILARWER